MSKKINIDRILFGVGLLLIGVSKLWRFQQNNHDILFLVSGLGLLVLKIFIDGKYSRQQLAMFILSAILALLVFIKTSEVNHFSMLIIVFSMKGIDTDKAMRELFVLNLFFFVGTIALCKMGFIYDDIYYFSRPGEIKARHSYGLGHPNQMFFRFFLISTTMLACFRKKHYKLKFILVVFLMMLIYVKTDSRTGLLCTILFLVGMGVLDISGYRVRRAIGFVISVSYYLVALLPVILVFLNNSVVDKIDKLITGRISLAKKVIDLYPVSIFGTGKAVTDSFVIDSSYLYILIHYGVLFFGIYFVAVGLLLRVLYKRGQIYEMMAVFVLHIYAIFECALINPIFNFGIFYMGTFVMNYLSCEKERKIS